MTFISYRDFSVLFLCVVLHLAYRNRQRRLLPLPPGPSRWPIVGNAFSIPLTYSHLFYKDLGQKLGSKFLYLEAFGRSLLIINDIEVAQDLLDKRSALYSSRPQLMMLLEVMKIEFLFATQPYGDEWRTQRRIFQQFFGKRVQHIQEKERDFVRKGLLPNFLTAPEDFYEHIRMCVGGISISITYGLPVQRRQDPLVQFAEHAFAGLVEAAVPGRFLVNTLPVLKYVPEWFPGAGFKTFGRKARQNLLQIMQDPYEETLKMMRDGTAPESFVSESLERSEDETHTLHVKRIAMEVFAALTESTVTGTMTLILAMLKYPDCQKRAQAELDQVLEDRLPDFQDIAKLPYLSALIKEVLRWNPIAPLGVPHMTSEDDVYDGFFIPKGCTVLANAYAMLHNEDMFPNPKEFRPERFLKDGVIRQDLLDPEVAATFGFGRRICPGLHVALPMLHLFAASILYLFDISPALDAQGVPIDVVPKFGGTTLISETLPFKCKIAPRKGKDVEGLLREYMECTTI